MEKNFTRLHFSFHRGGVLGYLSRLVANPYDMEDESFVLQRTSPSSFPAIEILQDLHADHAPSNKVSLLLFFSCSYIVLLLLFRLSSSLISSHPNAKVPAPIIGTPFVWLSRISFFFYAKQTIAGAYRRCGKIPFKLCGNDVIVLPAKYINEIRNVPSEQLNSILALLENSEGEYSMTTVLAQSELHTTVIRTRLTPKLGKLMKVLRDEFMYGMQKDFPQCSTNKWIPVTAYPVLHGIVGRMAARAFVGPRLCRNEKWLHHAEGYTNSAFPTIILMRLIPDWLKRISSWILPTPWITKYHAYKAFQILLPEIDERRRILAKNATSGVEKPVQMSNEINDDFNDNFCSMMMKEAEGDEADPKSIAGRTLSLTLASNHTTTMALVEALYDLCLHLEYQNELREEVKHALAKHGAWSKETLTTMRKLDSFIRESRRMHPPSQSKFSIRTRSLRLTTTLWWILTAC